MIKENTIYAPQVSLVRDRIKPEARAISHDAYLTLLEIYETLSVIKHGSNDKDRTLWLEVERGPIEAFGDYKEYKRDGEVASRAEFVQLWRDYYPEDTIWYEFSTREYMNEKFFFLDYKLIARIGTRYMADSLPSPLLDLFGQFTVWLLEKVRTEMNKLTRNPTAYNAYIRNNLPFIKRYGKIQRTKLWELLGDEANRFDKNLGEETVGKLLHFVRNSNGQKPHPYAEMTADTFFRICEIGYDANGYFVNHKSSLSPRDKYLSKADGRDAGLSKIDGDSAEEFHKWYHNGQVIGAHPWEICRGGNSTHISLYVIYMEGNWYLRLDGSSSSRLEETVRMAIALYENGINFELRDADKIIRKVTGSDYIGIVPDNILPVYCHGSFPEEDQIYDFLNLRFEPELAEKIVPLVSWYPVEEIIPVKEQG